jgi:P pilus assembly chaperone PapD
VFGRGIALGLALAALAGTLQGQAVMIAPNAIIIDGKTGTGAITLVNSGDRAAEISISTLYGYPVTDSSGRMTLRTFPVVDDTTPSAASWLRAFPERLMLAPGARRTVRLLAQAPQGLADREYWARLVVSSRPGTGATPNIAGPDTLGVPAGGDVRVGFTLEVRSVLGVFYRRGAVATGLVLDSARATVEADSIVARVRMARTGNAAFVGSLRAVVRDSAGVVRATATLPLGVYYTIEPRLAIPRTGLASGRYSLELDAVSARPDVAAGSLLPISPVRTTTTVTIPTTLGAVVPRP